PITFQVVAFPFGVTRLKRGSTHGLCNGGTVHDFAVASAYARRCWICARTPVRASTKDAGTPPPSVAPMPAKLLYDAGTEPPKRNQPVSRTDWMKATSPR